ncbi:MAG: alkaline phosphatase family protein, partial [bacterium]
MKNTKIFTPLFLLVSCWNAVGQPHAKLHTENVFLILVDGLRWQEVFTGADSALMNKENGGVENSASLKQAYWRDNLEARREVLLPFLWLVVAKQGQLFGNQNKGSVAKVTNGFHFSYPGYSEMIVGYADTAINSNDKRPNPNVSVFEWLHKKPRFKGKVAAFGAWDVVSWIINYQRCGFYVNSGIDPVIVGKISAEQALLNRLKGELHHPWGTEPYDAITFYAALEYIKANQPRALWMTFGETDEFAHAGRYDHYLDAARRTDNFLKTLWETLQSISQYRDKTTLIVVVDHGRGDAQEWTNHGADIKGAENLWIAIVGPDTPALGERMNSGLHTQSQIAATVAAALG